MTRQLYGITLSLSRVIMSHAKVNIVPDTNNGRRMLLGIPWPLKSV
jgi:hypothetical protein